MEEIDTTSENPGSLALFAEELGVDPYSKDAIEKYTEALMRYNQSLGGRTLTAADVEIV